MNDDEKEVLVVGGLIAGLYFFVVKPLLGELGLSDDDKQTIQAINTASPEDNPFNVNFIDAYMSVNGGNYHEISATDAAVFKAAYDSGTAVDPIASWAETIKGAFHWYEGGNADVVAVFSEVPDKAHVCDIARYLSFNYQIDLFTLLNFGTFSVWNGFLSSGLPAQVLANIVNHVNSLPVGI